MVAPLIVNKIFQANFRVYFEDTDQMGIMYHGNHLRFFERARTEMFREMGWSFTELAQRNYHFAIHEVQLRFLSPARLEEQLILESKVVKCTSCSMVFEQSMKNRDNTVLCEAIVVVVCVNDAMKPQRIPFPKL